MARFVRKSDGSGHLAGSIGDGKDKLVPTASQVPKSVPGNITRSEGYQAGWAKEAAGVKMAQDFLSFILDVPASNVTKILGKEENYSKGDLTLPSGKTIEVKRQPIGKYKYNFIELGEITSKDLHKDGQTRLGEILGIPEEDLQSKMLFDKRKVKTGGEQKRFGKQDYFSLSILSISNSHATIYVNPDDGYLYIYRRAEIIDGIRYAVQHRGLNRGMGRSNEDTISVSVDNPIWKYKRETDPASGVATWRYIGQHSIYSRDGSGSRDSVEVLKEYLRS